MSFFKRIRKKLKRVVKKVGKVGRSAVDPLKIGTHVRKAVKRGIKSGRKIIKDPGALLGGLSLGGILGGASGVGTGDLATMGEVPIPRTIDLDREPWYERKEVLIGAGAGVLLLIVLMRRK